MFDLSERYRPQRLADIIGQDAVVAELQGYVQQRAAPHLLFGGDPGTGKTTAAHAFVRDYHNGNSDLYGVFKEVNASDNRDIDFVRTKVLEFLRTWAPASPKFLLLDEADNLTHDAQDLLKRPLEKASRNAIVIFTANEPEKLTPALRSRLREIKFRPVPADAVAQRLCEVLKAEGFDVGQVERDLCMGLAMREARGDLRKACKELQSVIARGGMGPISLTRNMPALQ